MNKPLKLDIQRFADKEIGFEITANTTNAVKSLKELEKQEESNQKTHDKQSSSISKVANALKSLKTGSGSAISGFSALTSKISSSITSMKSIINTTTRYASKIYELAEAASDYSEALNLFNVVFGNIEENGETAFSKAGLAATKFQNQMHESFGTAKKETMEFQAIFQSMAQNMGIDSDTSEQMSETMTKLTYDLASLYNTSETQAANAIKSGVYAGQVKPLRNYGIDVTQANLKPLAESLGIDKSVSEMTQAEKQILRYIAVLKQSETAQGDFANTINSPANQLKVFKQQISELAQSMGRLLVPVYRKILVFANGIVMAIKEVVNAIADFLGIELEDYNSGLSTSVGESTEDIEDGISGIGDSADSATDSVKKLNRQLLGFDQVNNLTTSTSSSSSGGTGSGTSTGSGGISQQLLDAIGDYDNLMLNAHMEATDIRDRILEWLGFTKEVNEETGEIAWKYQNNILSGVYDVSYAITNSLSSALENIPWDKIKSGSLKITNFFTEAINGAIDGMNWAVVGTTIGEAIETSLENVNAFFTNVNFEGLGAGIGRAITTAVGSIEPEEIAKSIYSKINAAFDFLGGLISNIDFSELGNKIRLSVVEAIAGIDWGSVASTLVVGIESMLELVGPELVGGGIGMLVAGPLGAVVGAISAGIIDVVNNSFNDLIDATGKAVEATAHMKELYNVKPSEDTIASMQKMTENLNEMAAAAKETAESSLFQLSRYQDLEVELGNLVDENGNVVGSTSRVKDIINVLNEELGTNIGLQGKKITLNGKEVKSYNQVESAIKKVIAQKKAEIIVEAYKDTYIQALKDQAKIEEKIKNLIKDKAAIDEQATEKGTKLTEEHKNKMEDLNKQYDSYKNQLLEVNSRIETYEGLESAAVDGSTEDINNLTNTIINGNYQVTESTKKTTQKFDDDWENAADNTIEDMIRVKNSFPTEITTTLGLKTKTVKEQIKEIQEKASKDQSFRLKLKSLLEGNPEVVKVVKNLFGGNNLTNGIVNLAIKFLTGGKADGGIYKNGRWSPITQYATGGLPGTGQMFIAREAGPELVGKIGNSTAVMNNNQIVSSVASGVAQAVSSVMGNGNNGAIEVYVHTDEGTIVDRINRTTRKTGVCPIKI